MGTPPKLLLGLFLCGLRVSVFRSGLSGGTQVGP